MVTKFKLLFDSFIEALPLGTTLVFIYIMISAAFNDWVAILDFNKYGEAVGYKQDEGALGECFFKEPCEVTLKRIKSKNGSRSYFVFE